MSAPLTQGALAAFVCVVFAHRVRPRPARRVPRAPADPIAIPPTRFCRPPWARLARRRSRHAPSDDPGELATWCDRLARSVRSGDTISGAIRGAEPPPGHVDQVTRIVLALDRGASLADALTPAAAPPNLALALTVLRSCAEHGGPPAEPIDRTAAALRARAADLAERRTQSAQARMSAVVMTVLPIAMLVVLVATSSGVRGALASPLGVGVLACGAAFNLAGWRWMRRLVDGPTLR